LANFWLGPVASARGYRVFGYDEIGSTSTEAAKAAETGDVGDVWFASLKQTAGRGRRGRAWETSSGNLPSYHQAERDSEPNARGCSAKQKTQGAGYGSVQFSKRNSHVYRPSLGAGQDGGHRLSRRAG